MSGDLDLMRTHWIAFLIFIAWLTPACVSVDIGSNRQPRRSTSIHLPEPQRPFSKFETTGSEASWKSSASGNIITYLSECVDGYDPSLEALWHEVTQGLRDLKVEFSRDMEFQNRRALTHRFTAEVDGVESMIEILILKKNGCIYNFSYIATPKSFKLEYPQFKSFLSGINIP